MFRKCCLSVSSSRENQKLPVTKTSLFYKYWDIPLDEPCYFCYRCYRSQCCSFRNWLRPGRLAALLYNQYICYKNWALFCSKVLFANRPQFLSVFSQLSFRHLQESAISSVMFSLSAFNEVCFFTVLYVANYVYCCSPFLHTLRLSHEQQQVRHDYQSKTYYLVLFYSEHWIYSVLT